MFKNLLFLSLGAIGGVWIVWPKIITNQGWVCAKDIVTNADKKPSDTQSFFEDIERKIKLGSTLSAQTLLKAETLGTMDKLRVVGDACFR